VLWTGFTQLVLLHKSPHPNDAAINQMVQNHPLKV